MPLGFELTRAIEPDGMTRTSCCVLKGICPFRRLPSIPLRGALPRTSLFAQAIPIILKPATQFRGCHQIVARRPDQRQSTFYLSKWRAERINS